MKASSDHLLGHGHENMIWRFRGQPTFKVYYGIMRKAAIIASVQQRRLKMRMNAEIGNKYELPYWKDHYDQDEVNKNEVFPCERDMISGSSKALTEIEATESTEDNFKVQNGAEYITEIKSTKSREDTFILLKKNFEKSQEINAISNEFEEDNLRVQNCAQDITEIKVTKSREDTFILLKENFEKSQEINAISNEPSAISPVQKPLSYRALNTYEYQMPPRMAIVLPKPLQGRTVLIDPIDYIIRMRQCSVPLHMRMKVPPKEIWCLDQNEPEQLRQDQLYTTSYIAQNLCDIIGSLKSRALSFSSTSQVPASSIKPKKKAYGVILIFLLLILTIVVFYLIWTSELPEEILLTLSGMYTLLIAYIYFLVN